MSKKKKFLTPIAIMVGASIILFANQASAAEKFKGFFGSSSNTPYVFGTVSAIENDTLVVNRTNGLVYSVDASHADVLKDQKTQISVSDIKVGDTVLVTGTISGSVLSANSIDDL